MKRLLVLQCLQVLLASAAGLAACIGRGLAAESASPDLRLTLPAAAYAISGAEIGVSFDNLILAERPSEYRFVVHCDVGRQTAERWTVIPSDEDVGVHSWRIEVFQQERRIAEKTMLWHIVPAAAGNGRRLNLLLVGDSLTHATLYPNDLARRLSARDQPQWKMLGTHRPAAAAPGVAHEGYGGWTWERFVRHYEPMPDPAQRRHSSPFVFLTDGQPQLDVGRYLRESGQGQSPDYVLFLLGINDCFGANPEDPAAIDAHINRVFTHAETLLKAFRAAAPEAELAVCLTTPPNARESGFEANYQGRYHRWGWKRIQHRLVERELQQFSGREGERIHIVPTQLGLDPVAGYPVDNGVHPNSTGYHQIAASMHAWLVARLRARD
jgi:lysophospholipase L1-like esterase